MNAVGRSSWMKTKRTLLFLITWRFLVTLARDFGGGGRARLTMVVINRDIKADGIIPVRLIPEL